MTTISKGVITTLIIFLVSGHLLGQIKAAGKLIIPSADGDKHFKAVIRITPTELEIECSEKIFRRFNAFHTPKYRKMRVNTMEISEICVSEGTIFILPEDDFYLRYRNLFNPVWRIVRFIPLDEEEKMALIFIMDNPADIGSSGMELLDSINKRGRSKN
ncbi:MAG: hypothetical protein GTO45_35270 [Candidatus Aminicenantes bacterium]|nr:hypothetical protein [Candidatus Aminicenantes bacterium]NIM83947.1 hypothetical protein [Candidatus Aminicenantes bacterium]NIN23416.1 hypothetical protein [Candidatus Aminicenantes bacterium]NIN47120.1 hypothetical protein [Candidatus Aminicenantes bacterium]NIN90044.1 hypothetical protein [Candidatus Aminicenantes bacterium]